MPQSPIVGVVRPDRMHAAELHVSLLDLEPALRSTVPEADRPLARRVLTVVRHTVPAGPWDPGELFAGPPAFALLVTGGTIVQEVLLAGRRSARLVGTGDVLRPWQPADTELPCSTGWSALGGAEIAVLDERFRVAARRWPGLMDEVHARLVGQLDAAARHAAICGLPRVEDRLIALFWELAGRWGVVRPAGIVLTLPMTHDLLGRMIAAKRPTVSLALTALAERGMLRRQGAEHWVLAAESHATLEVPGLVAV